ncbi:MAG: hypothetical protein Q9215_003166 [Flavoplaca cf. flavocitrina]
MQEHIRRAHPEHYIAKLPATEESFQLMINTPPSEKPPPNPPQSFGNTGGNALLSTATIETHQSRTTAPPLQHLEASLNPIQLPQPPLLPLLSSTIIDQIPNLVPRL